jgi:hypothetical protein
VVILQASSNTRNRRRETLTNRTRIYYMRRKLTIFSALFVFVLGFEYLLLERRNSWPESCIVLIPAPWSRFLIALILAGGAICFGSGYGTG